MVVRALSEERAAETEAAHEDRQHCGGGQRRRPEDQPELAHPRRLIDERAEAGAEHE